MAQRFTNCTVIISDNSVGTDDVRRIEETAVHMYDSGYIQIPEISMVLPPHRIVGIETTNNHDSNL